MYKEKPYVYEPNKVKLDRAIAMLKRDDELRKRKELGDRIGHMKECEEYVNHMVNKVYGWKNYKQSYDFESSDEEGH
jgi:hypothetical protein